MFDFNDVHSNAHFFIAIGIIMMVVMPLFSIKDKKNRLSIIIFAVVGGITLIYFGVTDLKGLENPDVEVYIGEYVDYSKSGKNSVGEYTFDSHKNEESKIDFRAAQLANILGKTPEYGKWYAIYYLPNNTLQTVVKVEEVPPPDYYMELLKEFSKAE